METLQAMSARAHLKLLETRICCFRDELKAAMEEAADIRKNFETYSRKNDELIKECSLKRQELDSNYSEQIQEYEKQIKISEEMLVKETEKRQTMLDYLRDLNITIKLPDDVKDFDWSSIEKMASNCELVDNIEEQKRKANLLEETNELANYKLNEMFELLNATIILKTKVKSRVDELNKMANEWKQMIIMQEKKINKMREENIRLNILVKQCVNVNEPMSKYVTDNVRAKCQSFMNSSTVEELVYGLKKYKSRQDRIIKLLKHKENKLTRDINLLQVAKDRTADQMDYYNTIIRTD